MPLNNDNISSGNNIASRILRQIDNKILSIWALKLLLIIPFMLLCLIILYYLGIISINLKPFSTRGEVYVDSPEIYTRERLVNDRYEQDFWLRGQLSKLDDASNFVTAEVDDQISAGNTNHSNSTTTPPTQANTPQDKSLTMPFDQEFRIRTAIRDAIRQLVLENMLDDRHDLSGNTVYGLKFDTTVIPGENTRDRAFVRINLEVINPFNIDTSKLNPLPNQVMSKAALLPHLLAYYASSDPFSPDSTLQSAKSTYTLWLKSIENRLNLYIANKFKSPIFVKKCQTTLQPKERSQIIQEGIRETTNEALGYLGKSDMFTPDTYEGVTVIMLPWPWGKYMKLVYSHNVGNEVCKLPPTFTVHERSDEVTVFNNDIDLKLKKESAIANKEAMSFVKFGETLMKRSLAFKKERSQDDNILYANFEYFSPTYFPNDTLIDLKCNHQLSKGCPIWMPSGLFNFIESVQKSDSYSYAVFPKNDVAGILANSSVKLNLTEQAQGSSWLNLGHDRRESQLDSVMVGFGDGSCEKQKNQAKLDCMRSNQKEIQFGWVLSDSGTMTPKQKTELALISVPAWATQLKLNINVGWLDRYAHEDSEKKFTLVVPVPPDFQALDSLVLAGWFQRKPKILNNLMSADVKVNACEDAKILIPGSRLWRSATVTLGAQKANKISVLPNMEGIIAEFSPVEIPHRGDGNTVKTKLQVWTSEGVDTAENEIEIRLPENNATCALESRKI